jgi:transposase
MRGSDRIDLEDWVPARHSLRRMRRIVNNVLAAFEGEFAKFYAWPSIPHERLLRALLLQEFYTIPSERELMEQLGYNLLFRWFVGLGVDELVWVPKVFRENLERLLKAEVTDKFLAEVLNHEEVRDLLSDAGGEKPGGGRMDFCWLVFDENHNGPPELRWLHRDGGGT